MSVKHCQGCGYDLTGLGASGHCPECGAGHGGEKPLKPEDPSLVRHARPIFLAVVACVVLLVGSAMTIASSNKLTVALITAVVTGFFVFGAVVYWRGDGEA